jgi:hypothetical protein
MRQATIPVYTVYWDLAEYLAPNNSKLYLDLANFAVCFASPTYRVYKAVAQCVSVLQVIVAGVQRRTKSHHELPTRGHTMLMSRSLTCQL